MVNHCRGGSSLKLPSPSRARAFIFELEPSLSFLQVTSSFIEPKVRAFFEPSIIIYLPQYSNNLLTKKVLSLNTKTSN